MTMQQKPVLSLDDINRILDVARATARKNGWAVTIAVVDDGGHPLALQRLDGCAPVGAYISVEKARTSALGRRDSKNYEDMINGGRHALLSAPVAGMMEGGVPIRVDGHVVGAVGVSGVSPEQDACVARAGAESVVPGRAGTT
jgi:glc operon protein GlcG